MDFSITPVSRVFKNYQSQERIAELSKKRPVKTRQGQQEKVTISEEARAMLKSSPSGQAVPSPAPPPPAETPLPPDVHAPQRTEAESANPQTAEETITSEDFIDFLSSSTFKNVSP